MHAMSWRTWIFPELEHYDGFWARQGAINRCSTRILRNRKILLGYLATAVVAVGLPFVLVFGFDSTIFDRSYSPAIYGVCVMIPFLWLTNGAVRREMRDELRFKGLPICVKCGYDLGSIENSNCPECGFDNYLSVDQSDELS